MLICKHSGCTRDHLPSRCKAYGDIVPEEREKIFRDNKMCPICLLYVKGDICYTKITKSKPVCYKAECKREYILCIHDILKNVLHSKLADPKKDEERAVNLVLGEDGWRAPDNSWLNIDGSLRKISSSIVKMFKCQGLVVGFKCLLFSASFLLLDFQNKI
jgi:hypothetical protein